MIPAPGKTLLLVSTLALFAGSEVLSSRWQSSGKTAQERGIYRKSLIYLPPNGEEVSVQNLPIEERQVGYLTYDRGRRVAILDRKVSRGMEVLYLEYDGSSPRFFFDLFNHPPERCMASTGAEVSERFADEIPEIDGQKCLLQGMKVTAPDSAEERHIFKLVWVHPDHPIDYDATVHLKRVQAALATVPPPPARLLMAGLYGFDTDEAAREFFSTHVLNHLRLSDT